MYFWIWKYSLYIPIFSSYKTHTIRLRCIFTQVENIHSSEKFAWCEVKSCTVVFAFLNAFLFSYWLKDLHRQVHSFNWCMFCLWMFLDTGLVTIVTRMDMDSSPLRENPIITVIVTAGISPPGPQLSNSISLTFTVTDINDHASVCEPDNHRLMLLKFSLVSAHANIITVHLKWPIQRQHGWI